MNKNQTLFVSFQMPTTYTLFSQTRSVIQFNFFNNKKQRESHARRLWLRGGYKFLSESSRCISLAPWLHFTKIPVCPFLCNKISAACEEEKRVANALYGPSLGRISGFLASAKLSHKAPNGKCWRLNLRQKRSKFKKKNKECFM